MQNMTMSFSNAMRRTLGKLDAVPGMLQGPLRNFAIRRTIPFVGTAGLSIQSISADEVRIRLKNTRRVQNHIGSVHAAAAALLAETATGLVVGMNVQDQCIPLMKKMTIQYTRRSEGDLLGVATLPDDAIAQLHSTDKGAVVVPVEVTDTTGQATLICEMDWAWIPKVRKSDGG
mgnify:CR=1 FL=1